MELVNLDCRLMLCQAVFVVTEPSYVWIYFSRKLTHMSGLHTPPNKPGACICVQTILTFGDPDGISATAWVAIEAQKCDMRYESVDALSF